MGIGLIIRPACTVILSLNKGAFDIRIHCIELIKEDFALIGIYIDENFIKSALKDTYRKHMKNLIIKAAFREIIEKTNLLSKIRNIYHKSYEFQTILKTFNSKKNNALCINI